MAFPAICRDVRAWRPLLCGLLIGLALLVSPRLRAADDDVAALLQARFAGTVLTPAQADSIDARVQAFYARRQFAPAWNQGSRLDALLDQLHQLDTDGLDPQVYPIAAIEALRKADDAPSQARLDELATRSYLQAIIDLHRGKVDPGSLPGDNRIDRPPMDAAFFEPVFEAVDHDEVAKAFEQARPQHPLYTSLREALHKLRQIKDQGGWPTVPDGPSLKPGMSDPRVPALRRRLQLEDYLPANTPDSGLLYDDTLAQAVRQYQAAQYLQADGNLGDKTRAALNIPVEGRIAQLRLNLERARWLLPALENDLLIVDVAGFRITLYQGATAVWRARVQVGRETRRTPLLKSAIRYLTLDPAWTVPPTIMKKDVLPKVRKDPTYLTKEHLRVFNDAGQELSPDQVDWSRWRSLTLRQDPGPWGALGHVAFRFPNSYSIYLHDTPHQELFSENKRAFSSGCIRVENAHDLAVLLLNDPVNWNHDAFEKAAAEYKTRDVTLAKPVPILIAYWTVDLRDNGYAAFKPDLYGLDAPTLAALDTPYPAE